MDISRSAKNFMEHFTLRRQLPKLLLRNLSAKFLTERKYLMKKFNLCEVKISLHETIKYINSQTNSKSPGNGCLTGKFYKHFSSELAAVLLDVYDCCGELGTVGVTSRKGIISFVYKKGDRKDIANCRPI